MNKSIKAAFLIPFIAITAFFIYWLVSHYLFRDLVWDELVSLKNFTLVDFSTTVTHYPDVNNHVFFNLLNNIFCKALGIHSIYEAMDSPALARIFPILLTIITLFYTYKASSKFFNSTAGFMSVIILLTCIPFLNFTMQLRGYTMSMTFMAKAIYYIWSYDERPSVLNSIMTVFSIFGLMYAIPSNIYFVLSLGIIYSLKWFINLRKDETGNESEKGITKWVKNPKFYLLLFIGLGTVFAFLAYLPILEDILNERHLQQLKGQSFYSHTLSKVIPFVVFYILSYRFLFIIPLIFIVSALYRHFKRKEWSENDTRLLVLFLVILVSFGISLARGDKPHQRTFIPLAVVFSILFGSASYSYLNSLKWFKSKELVSFFTIFIYCVISFIYCDGLIQRSLHKAIISGEKTYNMFYNFYQSEEYGMENLDQLIEEVNKTGYPVLMAREIDRVAEGEYLLKNNILYYSTVWAKPSSAKNEAGFEYKVLMEIAQGMGENAQYSTIGYPPTISKESAMFVPLFSYLYQTGKIDQQNPHCYVLTFSPRWFEGIMQESLPNMKYERLNRKTNYHNFYKISLK